MSILRWAFRIFLFVLFFGFALLNTDRVSIDFLFFQWNAPIALGLLAFFVLGALLGIAFTLPRVFRKREEIKPVVVTAPPLQAEPSPVTAEPPRLN